MTERLLLTFVAALFPAAVAAAFDPPKLFPPNHLFVTSFYTDSVFEFDEDGDLVRTIEDVGLFLGPEGLAFGPDGLLYVSSALSNTVQRINDDISIQEDWSADSQLSLPSGLAFGPFGDLYICSLVNDHVVVVDGEDDVTLVMGPGTTLNSPRGLAFSPAGVLHVASHDSNEVLRFAADGTSLGAFGLSSLSDPIGVAFSPEGRMLVTSNLDDKVWFAAKAANVINSSFISALIDSPYGLVVGPNRLIYISSDDLGFVSIAVNGGVLNTVGEGAGMSGLGMVAFSPFVFAVKLSGKILDAQGQETLKVSGKGRLFWAPGSCRVMLRFEDDLGDPDDVASLLGSTFVLHGQEAGIGKTRLFSGMELPGLDTYFRVSQAALDIKGKANQVGNYVPSEISGTLTRTGIDDGARVFKGTIKSLKRLN